MSLVAQALSVTAQNLIIGQTWAGSDVLLQPVDPIGEVLQKQNRDPVPVVAVFVENSMFGVEGRATQGNSSKVNLKVFVYLSPAKREYTSGEGEDMISFELDQNTAGLTLNVMARMIDAAFHVQENDWTKVWKKMVRSVDGRDVKYVLVEIESPAIRIPVVEISYAINSIPDPDFGVPMTEGWQLFHDALQSSQEGQILAKLFKHLIENPKDLQEFEQIRNNFGLTSAGLEAAGVGPYQDVTTEAGAIPPLTENTVSAGNTVLPEG